MKTGITEEQLKKIRELRNPKELEESLKNNAPTTLEEAERIIKGNQEKFHNQMLIEANNLKYFQIAKMLNDKYNGTLIQMKAHFRGNMNSYSLVSLDSVTPEIGISGLTKEYAKSELFKFSPQKPIRCTPEKVLQSWIILNAIENNYLLPFGENLTFITSELVIPLENNKRIVNDILAIDGDDNLVVIELKSLRVNEVKEQSLRFKEVIESRDDDFFKELIKLMLGRNWNGKIRCMVVWPQKEGKKRPLSQNYKDVEVYEYYENFKFKFDK